MQCQQYIEPKTNIYTFPSLVKTEMTPLTRVLAKQWLQDRHPHEDMNNIRSSRYYKDDDKWFITLKISNMDGCSQEYLKILCQNRCQDGFYFLKVPFEFLKQNFDQFDVRSDGETFDLYLSALSNQWFVDTRGNGVDFSQFLQ